MKSAICVSILAGSMLVVFPCSTLGSSSSALREYKDGKFDQALKEYQQLLERRADDPRLHFNAGTAAYRNGQFAEATNQFSAALNSPDLKLQESAYYNRGNSSYWLGERSPDPKQRSEAWERSLKDYELSLKLNSQDPDAKFNRDFVKKKLEELKQQQQQQQSKQDKSDKQNQDQQQNQSSDQKQQDQQQKDQQQQAQQNQQQQNSGQQNQQQQDQQQQAEQKKQDQQQQQAAQQQQQQQQQQSAGQPKQRPEDKEREAAAYAAGQMTPEQAQQLLDAQKGQEMMLPVKPEGKPVDRSRPIKDW